MLNPSCLWQSDCYLSHITQAFLEGHQQPAEFLMMGTALHGILALVHALYTNKLNSASSCSASKSFKVFPMCCRCGHNRQYGLRPYLHWSGL